MSWYTTLGVVLLGFALLSFIVPVCADLVLSRKHRSEERRGNERQDLYERALRAVR